MEEKLSKMVFDVYVETETKEEFNKKIEEISKTQHKTINYLKYLMENYYKIYANKEEKIEYSLAKQKKKKVQKYDEVINELLSLPLEKRAELIITKKYKYSYIRNFCIIYLKNCKDQKKCEEIMELCTWAKQYCSEKTRKQLSEKQKLVLQKACYYFDELVHDGCYSLNQYMDYAYEKHGKDKYTFKKEMIYLRNTLQKNAKKIYNSYIEKMENNRKKVFNLYKNNVQNFVQKIDELDIIDYYIMFGMPILEFRKLCKGLIDIKDENKLNIFFSSYIESDMMLYPDEKVLNDEYYFNEEQITLEQKLLVLNFMKQNNIPNVYYFNALKKYMQDNLNKKQKQAHI